jgi:hypothetical protein
MDQREFARLGGLGRAKKHSTEEIQKWGRKGGLRSAENQKQAQAKKKKTAKKKKKSS